MRVSESEGSLAQAWLVVLPHDAQESDLARIRELARTRGWAIAGSRGAEQAVLALQGPRAAGELVPLVAGLGADVLPLLPPEHYRRLRARRRWLSALVAGLGLGIVAGILLPLLSFLRPPRRPIVESELLRVAAVEAVPTGTATRARFQDQPILVIRVAPQGWRAVGALCTQASDCLLEWDPVRQQIVCPCHGCLFDALGNVLHPPASVPLLRLEAFEQEGAVFVRRLL